MSIDRCEPWGKLTRFPDGRVAAHSLIHHQIDVASVFGALCDSILCPHQHGAAHAKQKPAEARCLA